MINSHETFMVCEAENDPYTKSVKLSMTRTLTREERNFWVLKGEDHRTLLLSRVNPRT